MRLPAPSHHHQHHHHYNTNNNDHVRRVDQRLATIASSLANMMNKTTSTTNTLGRATNNFHNSPSRLSHHPALVNNLTQGTALFRDSATENVLTPWSSGIGSGGAGEGILGTFNTNSSLLGGGSSFDSNSSDYVYDYDDSISNLPVDELVVNAIGYGLALLLGLIGNILVVVSVARYRRMHNVTNIFLMSLATADLLLVCICIPVKFARFFTFTWKLGAVMCKGVHYMQNVSIICSVLNLTGLSLERYYAILHPMRARYTCTVKLARRTVLIIWALSAVMALPILVGQGHILVGEIRKGYWCLEQWPEPVLHQVYQLYMLLIVYLMPLTFMSCNYVSICRRLWQVRYQRASIRAEHGHTIRSEPSQQSLMPIISAPSLSQASGNNAAAAAACLQSDLRQVVRLVQNGGRCKRSPQTEDATRKQVVKMLVAVVVLFAVCWGPVLFNNVLVAFGVLEQLHHGWLKPMRQAFWLMAYLNSSLNPIVYGFMSKNFRESFRNTVWRCVLRKPPMKDYGGANIYWRCSFQPVPSGISSARSPSVFSDIEGRHLSVPRVSIHRPSAHSVLAAGTPPAECAPPVSVVLSKINGCETESEIAG